MKGAAPLILGVIALAAIVFLAAGGSLPAGSINFPGFQTLSLNQVDFQSNDPSIAGKAWVLTVSQNGQGQSAKATFTNSEIKDQQTGEQATRSATITTSLDEESCNYPISNQYKPIYTMTVTQRDVWTIWEADSLKTTCLQDPTAYFANKGSLPIKTYCFKRTTAASSGIIGTPSLAFKSTISISNGQDIQQAVISNTDATSALLGNQGTVSWAGSLVSGEQCPIPSTQDVVAIYKDQWLITSKSAYDAYSSYDLDGFRSCISSVTSGSSTQTYQDCVQTYNNRASNAMQSKPFTASGGLSASTSGAASNGKVLLPLDKVIQYPVLTMRVKADYLGIYVPVGAPRIVSVSSQKFQTGSTGIIEAQIQNVGAATGSFVVSATCNQPVSIQGSSVYVSLNPGQTQSAYIPLSCQTNTEASSSCTVTVADRNNPSVTDSRPLTAVCTPILICSPDQRRCNGNILEQCNTAGSGWATVQTCEFGCYTPFAGTPQCNTKPNTTCKEHGATVNPNAGEVCCSGLDPQGGLFGAFQTCEEPYKADFGATIIAAAIVFVAVFVLLFVGQVIIFKRILIPIKFLLLAALAIAVVFTLLTMKP